MAAHPLPERRGRVWHGAPVQITPEADRLMILLGDAQRIVKSHSHFHNMTPDGRAACVLPVAEMLVQLLIARVLEDQ